MGWSCGGRRSWGTRFARAPRSWRCARPAPKPDKPATGLAALRIRTVDQEERRCWTSGAARCCRCATPRVGRAHADDLAHIAPQLDRAPLGAAVRGWRLDRFRELVGGHDREDRAPGTVWRIADGDVVSSAPELARLSLNVAAAHHDAASTQAGRRLVYGGHTIGIAAAQATRALPNLSRSSLGTAAIMWRPCTRATRSPARSSSSGSSPSRTPPGEPPASALARRRPSGGPDVGRVLDWRFVAVSA